MSRPDRGRAPRPGGRAPRLGAGPDPGPCAGPGRDGNRCSTGSTRTSGPRPAADGPLLIIAGPGTGKTRTLTHRIAHQIARARPACRQFLAITFTRRAAQEMQDRLAALGAGRASASPTVTTFHGLGLRILREHHAAAGLPPRFEVADEAARLRVAAELTGSERDGRKLAGDPDGRPALAPGADRARTWSTSTA